MAQVSSQIIEDSIQKDGRRAIRERHTDSLGRIQDVTYLAESGDDVAAIMAGRVAQLNAQIVEGEIAANVNEVMGESF